MQNFRLVFDRIRDFDNHIDALLIHHLFNFFLSHFSHILNFHPILKESNKPTKSIKVKTAIDYFWKLINLIEKFGNHSEHVNDAGAKYIP